MRRILPTGGDAMPKGPLITQSPASAGLFNRNDTGLRGTLLPLQIRKDATMDETTITGNLPNMKVEISHRVDAEAGAEVMTIQLRASPDFNAALPLAGGFLQSSLTNALLQSPLMGEMGRMGPGMDPMALWGQAMEMWMAPWRQLAQANPLLSFLGELNQGK